MKYIIQDISRKTTSTGKDYAVLELKDEQGVHHDKVSVWSDFTGFDALNVDSSVEGEIKTNDKGYKNLYASRPAYKATGGYGGGNRSEQMAKTMEVKSEHIKSAQDNKERGIMISSTARDATLILVELMKKDGGVRENWQTEWRNIRYWLYAKFEETSQPKVGELNYPDDKFAGQLPPF